MKKIRTFKYINIFYTAAAFFVVLILSSCAGKSDARVIVAGSTSVQPYAEILAEEFALSAPECEIDIQGGGSSAGVAAVVSGAAEIGMSSRDLNESESDLWSVTIARDGLAIIAHPDNPVSDLTPDEVRGIYAASITDWSEVGGNGAKIHVITREEGSGTRSAFEGLVMGDELITPRAIVQDSNGAVRQLVSNDKNSIGFISLGLVDDGVKALNLDGVPPTAENVINGAYELYRPFLLVCADEPAGYARRFIDYIFTPEAQSLMAGEGLIPFSFFSGEYE